MRNGIMRPSHWESVGDDKLLNAYAHGGRPDITESRAGTEVGPGPPHVTHTICATPTEITHKRYGLESWKHNRTCHPTAGEGEKVDREAWNLTCSTALIQNDSTT
jgi:hypothetical protein